MLSIFKKEISSFFNSLLAYVIMAVFLTAIGLIVWIFPQTSQLDYGYADLNVFFNLVPYVLIFLVPAVTMRSFAEEARNGTLELLLTKPLRSFELVLGKFLANWLVIILTLAPTCIYYVSLYLLGNPVGNIDSAAVVSSYVGLSLLSGALVSLGIWVSALSSSQIMSFVIAVFLGFFWFLGFSALSNIAETGLLSRVLSWFALDHQYNSLGLGLMDSRNILFMLSACLFFLALTQANVRRISA